MRVAMVIAGPYPALRGSQVLVGHLTDGLRRRGHDVHVVSYPRGHGLRPGPRPARLVFDAALVARLWRAVRRERIELLHAHNYEAAIASLVVGRITGLPVVYHGHSAHAEELPRYASRPVARRWLATLGRLLDQQVPRRATAVIAVTGDLMHRLVAAGVSPYAVACVEPAVPPGELAGTAAEPGEDDLVCYAGNLDGYQDVEQLLCAFARVRAAEPRARLRLVSHPDANAHAVRLAAGGLGAGVQIVLAGTYAEVRTELARAAVVASPRTEGSGFPMKLLTYMALGKAIVASTASAKGLEHGRTAWIVPDGDLEAFAGAIVGLLRDRATRARLGVAARQAVESAAAWEAGLTRIESCYARALANTGGSAIARTPGLADRGVVG